MQQQVIDYINKMLDKGIDPGRIVQALAENNWKKEQVEALVLTEAKKRLGQELKHSPLDIHPKAKIPEDIDHTKPAHMHDHIKTSPKFLIIIVSIILVIAIFFFAFGKSELMNGISKKNMNPISNPTTEMIQRNVIENFCIIGQQWNGLANGEVLINREKTPYAGEWKCFASSDKSPDMGYFYFNYNDVVYKQVEKELPFDQTQKYIASERIR